METGAGLARGGGAHYLGAMPLPRPASPRALWRDLRAFAGDRSRHQLVAAFFAVLMPVSIIVVFYYDGQTNVLPGPQVIYVESWRADRSDEEIVAKQKADQERIDAWRAERQEQFQKIDDSLERLGI